MTKTLIALIDVLVLGAIMLFIALVKLFDFNLIDIFIFSCCFIIAPVVSALLIASASASATNTRDELHKEYVSILAAPSQELKARIDNLVEESDTTVVELLEEAKKANSLLAEADLYMSESRAYMCAQDEQGYSRDRYDKEVAQLASDMKLEQEILRQLSEADKS